MKKCHYSRTDPFIKLFNKLNPSGNWHDGNSYDYKNAEGLDTIDLESPPCVVIVAPTVSGMIYYEPITLQTVVNKLVKNLAEEEDADMDESVDEATEEATL